MQEAAAENGKPKQQKKKKAKGRATQAGGIPNAGSSGRAFASAFASIGLVRASDLATALPLARC